MNPTRFAELAEAYGGDIARWPAGERTAAQAWATGNAAAGTMLADARLFDAALAAYAVAPPSADLQRRVVTRLLGERRLSRRLAGWLAALAALAGLGAVGAGATAGAAMVSVAPAPSHPSSLYEQSSFGDFGTDDGAGEAPGA